MEATNFRKRSPPAPEEVVAVIPLPAKYVPGGERHHGAAEPAGESSKDKDGGSPTGSVPAARLLDHEHHAPFGPPCDSTVRMSPWQVRTFATKQVVNKYGKPLDKGYFYKMLNNRVYLGEAVHSRRVQGDWAALQYRAARYSRKQH